MKTNSFSARDIIAMPLEEVWRIPDQPMNLKFDDGEIVTYTRATIFSRYIFEFHRKYPKTPVLIRHHIDGLRSEADYKAKEYKQIRNNTHLDLLSNVLWDCYDAYKWKLNIEELGSFAYHIVNMIYNDVITKLEAYVSTISAIDFYQLVTHPMIVEANNKAYDLAERDRTQITETHREVTGIIMDPHQLQNNAVARAARAGLVSMGQVLQCISPRGYPTDIDSNIFRKPILRGFFHGLRLLEDSMKESRSSAKALFNQEEPMRKSEYFNRNIQLGASILQNLHPVDCGSKRYINFLVRPGDLKRALLGIYYVNDAGKIEAITRQHKHLIGKTIKIRNVFGCQHPDPYGVCATCFGELAMSIPSGTNIGHFSTATMQGDIVQIVLSTKHHEASATVTVTPLDTYTSRYFTMPDEEGTEIWFNDSLKNAKVKLHIPSEAVNNLFDVLYVDDIRSLVVSRLTEINVMRLEITRKGKQPMSVSLNLSNSSRDVSFTHAALEYIRKYKWKLSKNGDCIINFVNWRHDAPVFELPLKHRNTMDYLRDIEKFLRSTAKKEDTVPALERCGSPEQALSAFHDIISSRMDVSISHIQTVLYTMMARDKAAGDMRLPKPPHTGEFASYRDIMAGRSLTSMMAFQGQSLTMVSLESFLNKKRPRNNLDQLLKG